MTIYITILFLAIINFLIQQKREINILNFILFTLMMLVCALRASDIGADTSAYINTYSNIDTFQKRFGNTEFVFCFIVRALLNSGFSVENIQFIFALITYGAFYVFFRKVRLNTALSILIFVIAVNGYFLETFNIVRQIAATPFLLLSYTYLNEEKKLMSALFAIIAIGFHMSSLIYIPFVVLAYCFKFPYVSVVISVIASFVFTVAISSINLLTNALNSIMLLYDFGDLNKYSHYSEYKLDLAKDKFSLMAVCLIPSILSILAYKKLNGNLFARIYFLGVVLLNIVAIMPTSYRMAYGLTSLELLLFPAMLSVEKSQKYKYTICAILITLTLFKIYTIIKHGEATSLVPYESYL